MPDLTAKLVNRPVQILGHDHSMISAVILPLVENGEKTLVLFEVRADTLTVQPAEICFPGGRIEPTDPSPKHAAVRETCEELGLKTTDLVEVGPLDVLVAPFNSIIYPFVYRIRDVTILKPNAAEVKQTFTVPLEFLMTCQPRIYEAQVSLTPPADFPYHLVPGGNSYPWRRGTYPIIFYQYEDRVIWGITARILHHFLSLL